MGYESMRPGHSKFPNLVIAMIIVCLFLTYNWWSLSAQNYELLRQTDDIAEQLKICADEKSTCQTRKTTAESQFREMEARMADMKMFELKSGDEIKKQKKDIGEMTKTIEKMKQEVGFCQTELESTKKLDISKTSLIAAGKMEKETLLSQLTEAKEKIKDLEKALKAAKPTTVEGPKGIVPTSASAVTKSKESILEMKPDAGYQQINNDPIQGGNHESYRDESPNDNPQPDEFDEPADSAKLARQ